MSNHFRGRIGDAIQENKLLKLSKCGSYLRNLTTLLTLTRSLTDPQGKLQGDAIASKKSNIGKKFCCNPKFHPFEQGAGPLLGVSPDTKKM